MAPASRRCPRRSRGFSIVELIVVVAIIALILGIGLPAFNAINASSRLSKTRQLITGTLTRAHAVAVSDHAYTAVRFMPSAWEVDDSTGSGTSITNRNTQLLATYRYVATSQGNPANISAVQFAERFERLKNGPAAILPGEAWAAPAEALVDANLTAVRRNGTTVGLRDAVLNGRIGEFDLNADALLEYDPAATNPSFTSRTENFLDADDFLVVFDPETGVVGSQRRSPWRMLGYDPRTNSNTARSETSGEVFSNTNPALRNPYQRMNFTGVVIYPRAAFVALGPTAAPQARYDYLSRTGKKYLVARNGGGLLEGN